MEGGDKVPYGIIKGIRKLIVKELEAESSQSFTQIIRQLEDVEPENPHFTHERVACDGCGMSPIVGTRYKCSVC